MNSMVMSLLWVPRYRAALVDGLQVVEHGVYDSCDMALP